MKNYLKTIAFVAVVGMAAVGTVSADEWNKKTVITTDEVMQLPNMMLQPGTYVIKLADSNSNRHIVQFFDKDEKHLVTTVLAIPNQRLRLTGKSVFAFWEVPAGQPKALRAWFYPGDNFGQEFAYPRREAAKITASNNGANVPLDDRTAGSFYNSDKGSTAAASNEAASASAVAAVNEPAPAPAAPVAASEPTPAPTEVAAVPQQTTPEPAATQAAPMTPAQANTTSDVQPTNQAPEQPDSLPKTASNLPWVGLLGLLSIIGAWALNLAYRRS